MGNHVEGPFLAWEGNVVVVILIEDSDHSDTRRWGNTAESLNWSGRGSMQSLGRRCHLLRHTGNRGRCRAIGTGAHGGNGALQHGADEVIGLSVTQAEAFNETN